MGVQGIIQTDFPLVDWKQGGTILGGPDVPRGVLCSVSPQTMVWESTGAIMGAITAAPKGSGYWEMFYKAAEDHIEDLGAGKEHKSDACMKTSKYVQNDCQGTIKWWVFSSKSQDTDESRNFQTSTETSLVLITQG